jgi:hypothetical protein
MVQQIIKKIIVSSIFALCAPCACMEVVDQQDNQQIQQKNTECIVDNQALREQERVFNNNVVNLACLLSKQDMVMRWAVYSYCADKNGKNILPEKSWDELGSFDLPNFRYFTGWLNYYADGYQQLVKKKYPGCVSGRMRRENFFGIFCKVLSDLCSR